MCRQSGLLNEVEGRNPVSYRTEYSITVRREDDVALPVNSTAKVRELITDQETRAAKKAQNTDSEIRLHSEALLWYVTVVQSEGPVS